MKRLLCCFLVLGVAFVVKAQGIMPKVREIYDFQVGDVFVYENSVTYFKNTYTERTLFKETILKKEVTQNHIIYTTEIREKNPVIGIVKLSYGKDTINNLDSSIFSNLKWPLPEKYDKDKFMTSNAIANINNSYGVDTIYQNRVFPIIPIFEVRLSYQRNFAKGLGMVSYSFFDAVHSVDKEGTTYKNELIYYKKNAKEWGQSSIDFNIYNIPLKKEIFDFEVGDIFTYVHYENKKFSTAFDTTSFSKVRIVAKEKYADKLIYFKEVSLKKGNKVTMEIEKDTIFYIDSVIFYKLKWLLPASEPKGAFVDTDIIGYNKDFGGGIEATNSVRYGPPIPGPEYRRSYMKGLGEVFMYNNDFTYQPQKQFLKKLVYYKKSNVKWGTDIDFIVSSNETLLKNADIRVYPNPISNDKLYFIGLGLENSYKYHIYNSLGNKLQSGGINNNLLDLSILQLIKGFYFIQIIEGTEIITTQKICIN
jgi:hypothetical protein